ncbi:MAG: ABC transporter ATP-binding protein/permease, partial [Lachnospiraceae bacterium]|nr:ABC transporter ATP-binding protein/permease [Lachnospiraceae bacterium]
LFWFCLFAVGGTFLLSVLKYVQDAKVAVGYSCLFSVHEICLTQKNHRLPYEVLEMPETERLREQVSGSISVSGAGMASLYWDMEVVITNLFKAIMAILLGANFFKTLFMVPFMVQGGEGSRLLFPALLFLVGICVFVSCKMAGKHFDVSFEVFEKGAQYSRYGEFYTMNYLPDENAAMDARIFSQEGIILRESQEKCYQRFAAGKRREIRAVNWYDGIRLLSVCFCGAATYALVGYMALSHSIGAGEVVAAYASVTMLISALSELAQIFTDLRNNNEHLLNYFKFMDLSEKEDEIPPLVKCDGRIIGRERALHRGEKDCFPGIRFEHVSFRYPDSEAWALYDFCLDIRTGEKLALVGENGSGKTSFVKLLCRLYRPTQGRILLDGLNIWDYPWEEYQKRLAAVFQDFSLFAFPIAENVAASDSYGKERVEGALKEAGLWEKVKGLPKGIAQPLFHHFCEEGCDLSGGEAQKLAIARAVYKDADIMILDEPTAALDPFAEAEIYKNFGTMSEGKTALLISHRLSSCKSCDRVAVFQEGRLVQLGSHKELLLQEGKEYARLWEAQAQYYR